MAGIKKRSGGKREGAGRKPKQRELSSTIKAAVDDVIKYKEYLVTCDMRNLKFPQELEGLPYAKSAWEYVLDLNEHSSYKLLNERHFETIKSYCLAVSMRQQLVDKWKQLDCPTLIMNERGEAKTHPLVTEIEKKSTLVNKFADDLALSVLGELKAAKVKAIRPEENKDEELGLFE